MRKSRPHQSIFRSEIIQIKVVDYQVDLNVFKPVQRGLIVVTEYKAIPIEFAQCSRDHMRDRVVCGFDQDSLNERQGCGVLDVRGLLADR